MKLFVDSADLCELEKCLRRGFPAGVTTNPMIIARSGCLDWQERIDQMIDMLEEYRFEIPLSVEVCTTHPEEMLMEAETLWARFSHYPQLNIKIPVGWDELEVIAELTRKQIPVNATCCMSYNQAVMAAGAGARFVSIFWGRIRDTGFEPATVVRAVKQTFEQRGIDSEIIVGSIRHMADVNEAVQAGADIVTVPPSFFPAMCAHPKTTEAVQQFSAEFESWKRSTCRQAA